MKEQEIKSPAMKLESMVYQLMRLCEKLEAGGDRGIQRDIELRATVESLNKTIVQLNKVGPILEQSVKETTQITVNQIYGNLVNEIKKVIDQHVAQACKDLAYECGKVERIVREKEDLTVKNDLMYAVMLILVGSVGTIGALIVFKCLT